MENNITTPLNPGTFYHIFNRGNDGINIFYLEKNYRYFLIKYDQYMSNYLDMYSYCLLPNHFHLLVKVKSSHLIREQAELDFPRQIQEKKYTDAWAVSERLRRFFMSYSKSINRQEGRTGSLFQKYFRRKTVNENHYLTHLVGYIHNNPVHHGIHHNLETYPWSSYQRILNDKPSKLMKKEVITLFGGQEKYQAFHQQNTSDAIIDEALAL